MLQFTTGGFNLLMDVDVFYGCADSVDDYYTWDLDEPFDQYENEICFNMNEPRLSERNVFLL